MLNIIDLTLGYWQVSIYEECVLKIAFKMRWGLFDELLISFGITNAPLLFIHLAQDVLHGYLGVFMTRFIDAILVYSRNAIEHTEHPRLCFERLRKYKFLAKASMCMVPIKKAEFFR